MDNTQRVKKVMDDVGFWGILGLIRDVKYVELGSIKDVEPTLYEIDVVNFLLGVEKHGNFNLDFVINDCLDCIKKGIEPQKYLQQIISYSISYWHNKKLGGIHEKA